MACSDSIIALTVLVGKPREKKGDPCMVGLEEADELDQLIVGSAPVKAFPDEQYLNSCQYQILGGRS